ncbi:hypothetical protein GCM10023186_25640 [Hymenobacter koreensis]|uniref:Uncharacterized protein n=2 Tax=Hymenobacter koreensis TaxID=1084523 RepID=A0ABP8J3A7_9BACT
MKVYRGQDMPSSLQNISFTGLVDVTYDKPISSQPLMELRNQRGLAGPVVFVLNGNRLTAAQVAFLRFVPEAIGQVQVSPANATNMETVISIQTNTTKPPRQAMPNDPLTGKPQVILR